MEQARSPVNLFYSYAREDEGLRNELEKHLSLLQRRGLITAWHDRKIEPGEDWSHAIDRHLNESSIILLLISHHYMASDDCYVEMQRALERHEMGEAQVIPVLLSPSDLSQAPFAHLRCLPRDDKPVTEWGNREAAFRDIAEGLRRSIGQQRQIEESKEQDNRTEYLDYLMKRYRTVTLPFGPVEGFALQAIFQPLTLRRDPLAAEDLQREKRRALLGETLPEGNRSNEPVIVASTSQDALQKSPQKRMVILGGPGTGKSTVLQFLIAEQTQAARDDSAALLPIMVSLPDLSRSGKTLGEYLLRLTREAGVSDQFAVILKKAIEGGQAFLCLDSLDEVSPDQRPTMIRTINELASSTGNTWVIGSRFTEYKGGQFQCGQFTEWELQAMSPSLRQELARRLLPELYHLLKPPLGMVEEAPLAFVRLLEAHVQAAAWCENPLLFSLAAVVFVRLGTLPTSRAALYQQVIDAVLETREKDRLRRKVLLRVLSDLALGLYTAKGRAFSLDDLLDLLPSIRQRQHENWATDEIAQRLITSGMLDVLAHETYGFRHQTFQEYLAAVELAHRLVSQDQAQRDETWEFVWSKRAYSRWTEVLRLMVGTLTQRHRRAGAQKALDWLSELAGQQHEPEGDPGHLGLALALKSLAEVEGTTTPYWKDVGGSRVEEALVATWVVRLLDASHQGNTTQQRQLGDLCTDLVHLEPMIAKVALERTRVDLHDGDPRIRIAAIRALESLGVCVPAELLIAALHDTEWPIRAAAAKALGLLRERMSVAQLLAILYDSHEEVRTASIKALGNLGENAPLEPLVAALNDPAWNVRRAAVEALGKPALLIPLERLISMMQDTDPAVRVAVVEALEGMGKDAPLEILLMTLHDESGKVRKAVATALGNFGEQMPIAPLLKALDEEVEVSYAAARSLITQIQRVPIEPVLALINKKGKDRYGHDKYESRRSAALDVLGNMGKRAPVDTLLVALHDESEWVRRAAITALGKLKTTIASDAILAILNNIQELPSVRAAALEALVDLEENGCVTALLAALNDPVEEVRKAAAKSLGKIKIYSSVEYLLTAASEHIAWVRLAAVSILGKMEEKAPIELLLVLINNKNEADAVRAAATQAIVELGEYIPIEMVQAVIWHKDAQVHQAITQLFSSNHSIFPPKKIPVLSLLVALKHENHTVRHAAAWGLAGEELPGGGGHLAPQQRLPRITAWLQKRHASSMGIPDGLLVMLIELLNDDDDYTYMIAAQALGELEKHISVETGRHISVELLRKLLIRGGATHALIALEKYIPRGWLIEALKHEHWQVRRGVAWVMGEGKEPIFVRPLLAALQDQQSEVRFAAMQTLPQMKELLPPELLLEALKHEHWQVRKGVIEVMGEGKEPIFVRPLLAALQDQQSEVRLAAAQALAEMKEPFPPAQLLEALHDQDISVRLAVASTLQTLAIPFSVEVVEEMLHHPDIAICLKAVPILAALGERVPTELLLAALNSADSEVRSEGAWTLSRLGEHIPIELWTIALCNENEEVRRQIAWTLYDLGGRLPQELLFAALNYEDVEVSWRARRTLSSLEIDIPEKILEDALNTGTTEMRHGIAYILGRRWKKASVELLLRVMDDPDESLRDLVAQGLAESGIDAPTEWLAEALQCGSPRIRQTVAKVLGEIEENVPIHLLLIVLQEEDHEMRRTAAQVISKHAKQLPTESLLACLYAQTDTFVLKEIVDALESRNLGEQVPLEPMLNLLDSKSEWLRAPVVRALGQFGTRAPQELLTATLGDSDQHVREAAAEALKKTHPETLFTIASEAIAILQGQKPGTTFGSLAQWFFADIVTNMEYASPVIFEKLTLLLDWPYWQVRVKAINAFGKLRRNIPNTAIQRLLQLRYDPQSSAVRRAADEVLAEILSLETGIEDD